MTSIWQIAAANKRAAILAAIPLEWHISNPPSVEARPDITNYIQKFLSHKEVAITQSCATIIATKVAAGEWSAEETTRAFCHVAALAHQLLNCLHEVFFDAALESARALDAYFAQHGRTVGPLHGVPVSLKDQFHVRGVETTMGYVGWIDTFQGVRGTGKEKVVESVMVEMLRKAGAVLFVKTSVPVTLMSGETVNNIIGYTTGGKNRRLSAGGSSGGEGALIGVKGSPLGLGTDIGGSIRIPAAFNGLFGLRPSVGRLPYHGMANSMDGQNSILSVVGPLATSAESLRLLTRTILTQKPWELDPDVVEMPWREEHEADIQQRQDTGGLVFAVYVNDGVVAPHPPILRAVNEVAESLRAAGHKVVEWNPPSHKTIVDAGIQTWIFDAGRDVQHAFALSGELTPPQVSSYDSLTPDQEYTATRIASVNRELRALRKGYLDHWNSVRVGDEGEEKKGRRVDAVITPVAPFAAARPGRYKYYAYSAWVNVLDYTSVVVPVTNVDGRIDGKAEEYTPLSELDKEIQEDYDPELYDGAHVSLQLVGRRLEEEKMLSIAEYVGRLVRK